MDELVENRTGCTKVGQFDKKTRRAFLPGIRVFSQKNKAAPMERLCLQFSLLTKFI